MIINKITIEQGQIVSIDLPITKLATGSLLTMPISVIRGEKDGPCLCLSSTIHGDELNGIEIIRRVLERLEPSSLRGTVIAAPIVNVFGFLNQERYLPDRRDLNRSFPGSKRGSMAARLANLFIKELLIHAQVGIDLHTGSNHRTNLPQIRAALSNPETLRLAKAFSAPIMIDSKARDGSLRATGRKMGLTMMAYEAGETHRFNKDAIEYGTEGILNVMHALRMIKLEKKLVKKTVRAQSSYWLRASQSGLFRCEVALGDWVKSGTVVGRVSDPLGDNNKDIISKEDGIVIGNATKPFINQGDALVHIATK